MTEINEYFENEQLLEGPQVTATRDSKIRLRLKADPLNSKKTCRRNKLPLFITNQNKDYFQEEMGAGGRMRNVFLSHYTVSQANFSIYNAQKVCRRLLVHVVKALLTLYKQYPGFNDFFPLQVEMRCYKLVNFLISYEIIALFTPEYVKIDPF